MTPKSSPHFERTLTLFDAIGIVVCAMIGSGIFIVSSQMAGELQSGSLILLAWILSVVISLLGALVYGELAAAWPQVGGQYAYIKNAWGQLPAFLYGWTLSFIIKSGSIAAVAIGFSKFLCVFFPAAGSDMLSVGSMPIDGQKLIAIAMIGLLTWLNTVGIKWVARLQNVVTVTNLLALALIVGVGLIWGFNGKLFAANMEMAHTFSVLKPQLLIPLGAVLVGPLFALDGWNNVTFIAAEIKKPERNLPLSLIIGVCLTGLLYLLVNAVYLSVLSLQEMAHAHNGVVGASLMRAVWGTPGEILITAIILVAALGCVNSMVLSGSRAIYALAKDGFLMKGLTVLGQKSSVPENALWVQCAWSVLLVLSRAFSELLDSMVFAALLFYALTVAGIFILRRQNAGSTNHYRVWGYPFLPILYCVFCAWIIVSLLWLKPLSAGISVAVVLSGLPFYWFANKKKKSPEQSSSLQTLPD